MEKKIEIIVDGKEWKGLLDKAFKKVSKKVKIDGFRPGKAPKDVFFKKYGKGDIYMEAANDATDIAYQRLLDDYNEDIKKIVARPEISLAGVDDEKVTFEFVLTKRPEVKLGKYKNLNVKKEKVSVSLEEIENSIKSMRERYAEDVIKEGAIENGDIAVIDYEGFIDGVAFAGGKGENYSLKIGSGTFIPGFEEALIGLKAEDEKDIKVTFPKDYHAEELKGKDAIFKVKVHEVKEVKIPELDKEFFEDLGMEGINSKEDLEKQISENIKVRKEMDAENKYLDELIEAASKDVKVEIPEIMITDELDRMIKQYSEHLKMQGLTLEQFYQFTNSDEKALKSQMRAEAIKRITYRLTLEEIASAEKIEISDEEADEEALKLADKYQMEKEEFLKQFGGLDIVKYDLKMRKVIEILKK